MIVDCKLGKNVKIIEPVNIYGATLEDNCFVGPFVEIQKNVTIGKDTRISSHSFICENTKIGEKCFIGHGVMFTNDKFDGRSCERPAEYLKTILGNNVQIGTNSTLLPVTIGDGAIVGAGSVVTKDVLANTCVCGNPARILEKK